jgi:hypothetical protein
MPEGPTETLWRIGEDLTRIMYNNFCHRRQSKSLEALKSVADSISINKFPFGKAGLKDVGAVAVLFTQLLAAQFKQNYGG